MTNSGPITYGAVIGQDEAEADPGGGANLVVQEPAIDQPPKTARQQTAKKSYSRPITYHRASPSSLSGESVHGRHGATSGRKLQWGIHPAGPARLQFNRV